MLGPSDFRKNLSSLLDLHSSEQYALQRLLEYRLPSGFSAKDADTLRRYVCERREEPLPGVLDELFAALGPRLRQRVLDYLSRFFDYQSRQPEPFPFGDCSLGNLVFAGAYLTANGDFNSSVDALARLCGVQADVVNVTRGEARTLTALKENGELLTREAEIVGPQSDSPILDIFFLEEPLTSVRKGQLEKLEVEAKRKLLREWESPVRLSEEAAAAIAEADVIVYGPGTQFSSLFPSYRTEGITEALRGNAHAPKVFVANLDRDFDIQSLSVTRLLDKAFEMMSDEVNQSRLITHVLYNGPSLGRAKGIKLDESDPERGTYKGVSIVRGEFENPVKPSVHSGYSVVREIFALRESQPAAAESLDVYVDLLERSQATGNLLQEFFELPWTRAFSSVRLRVNRLNEKPSQALPEHLQVEAADSPEGYSEVDALTDWLSKGTSAYLVTLTGDGEYRMRDAFLAREVFQAGLFGVVHGSRTQSRRQFLGSLQSAYGESRVLRAASWLGAFVVSLAYGMRFRVVLSDPLTGFRVYKRSRLNERFRLELEQQKPRSAAEVTRLLLDAGVEIAEVPVHYRTFAGFTKPGWRIRRGLRGLLGILR